MRRLIFIAALLLFCAAVPTLQAQYADTVDTQIGTHGSGYCHVGVSAPFGLTNAAVYRPTESLDMTLGVSLLNIQGTGCQNGALGHVIVRGASQPPQSTGTASKIYYRTTTTTASLLDVSYDGLRHQATARPLGVIHRLLRGPTTRDVVINLGDGYQPAKSVTVLACTDSTIDAALEVGGFCTHPVYRTIYVRITVKGARFTTMVRGDSVTPYAPQRGAAFLITGPITNDTATVRVAVSLCSMENAVQNDVLTLATGTFNEHEARTRAEWESWLGRFRVEGGSTVERRIFYTGLYRIMQHPSLGEDANGDHVRFNANSIDNDPSYVRTVGHDIWSFFQTNLGFYGMFLQDQWSDVMRTLVEMSIENGDTPQFDFLGKQAYIMGGDPFPLVALDAALNGTLSNDDVRRLLPIFERASTQTENVRPFTYLIRDHGFIPAYRSNGTHVANNVANVLEYSMADAANAILSQVVGDHQRATRFAGSATRLWNVFDQNSGWFRERLVTGDTVVGFDPDSYDGEEFPGTGGPGFKEGSGREFLFYNQHVRREVARRLGGWNEYARRLDPLFEAGARPYIVHNQIQMHLPFQYLYVPDSAHKAQRLVHEARLKDFQDDVLGLPGNDDLGSTSAWVVLSMMGLYPTTGFEGTWLVVAPQFDKVTIDRAIGKSGTFRPLTIQRVGERGPYVKSVFVDGKTVSQTHIDDHVLRTASTVVIETAATPQEQPRMWNRTNTRASWFAGAVTFTVDDEERGTPLEISIGHVGTEEPLAVDTLLPDVQSITMTPNAEEIWWTVRDLGDPSGRAATVRLTAARSASPASLPLAYPSPASDHVYLSDHNGQAPIALTAVDIQGRHIQLDLAHAPYVDTRKLANGVYQVVAEYPGDVTRRGSIVITR